VNVQEYISSGILEPYVLGDVTETERQQVEMNLAKYPELREELMAIEKTFEQVAFSAAVKPSAKVKEQLFKKIENKTEAKVVSIAPKTIVWQWAAAASIIFGLVAAYLAYDYRDRWQKTVVTLNELINRNQQFAQDYNQINLQLEKLQTDVAILENSSFTKVILKGTTNSPEALASVYWNASTEEAYLSIQNLKKLSRDQQFQLWAIVDGKPVDAGVFDSDFAGLLKMKNIKNAAAFAVTIEPRGGKPSPTLETMQVMGPVPKV
jgi:anti-sigma-K factor RskA